MGIGSAQEEWQRDAEWLNGKLERCINGTLTRLPALGAHGSRHGDDIKASIAANHRVNRRQRLAKALYYDGSNQRWCCNGSPTQLVHGTAPKALHLDSLQVLR